MPEPTVPSAQDEVVDICRDLIRIDSSNYGDGTGPGERAAAEYVAGLLSEVGLEPARVRVGRRPDQPRRPVGGRGLQPPRAARPRPPRRRTRRGPRLDPRPVRRRDRRRLRLGPGRGRHEGHGRDGACALSASGGGKAASRRATSSCVSSPTRRPAEARARTGWSTTTPASSRASARPSARSAASRSRIGDERRLPDRDRAEGHPLAAARRRGSGRPRFDGQRRQRRHRAGRGRRPHRPPRLAAADDPDRAALPRGDVRRARHRVRPRPTPSRLWPSSAPLRGSSARHCATPPTRPCCRPATSTTSSRSPLRRSSTAASCPASRTSCSRPSTS